VKEHGFFFKCPPRFVRLVIAAYRWRVLCFGEVILRGRNRITCPIVTSTTNLTLTVQCRFWAFAKETLDYRPEPWHSLQDLFSSTLCITIQFIPRREHSVSIIQTSHLMLLTDNWHVLWEPNETQKQTVWMKRIVSKCLARGTCC